MVEEAERTNSPSSCSFVTASLEVIPSSFASSWTRYLATFLLSRSAPSQVRTVYFLLRTSAADAAERPCAERNKVVIVAYSSLGTHRVSISFLTRFQVWTVVPWGPEPPRVTCLQGSVRRRPCRSRPRGHGRKRAVWLPASGSCRWGAATHPGQPSGVVHPPGRRETRRLRRPAGSAHSGFHVSGIRCRSARAGARAKWVRPLGVQPSSVP